MTTVAPGARHIGGGEKDDIPAAGKKVDRADKSEGEIKAALNRQLTTNFNNKAHEKDKPLYDDLFNLDYKDID